MEHNIVWTIDGKCHKYHHDDKLGFSFEKYWTLDGICISRDGDKPAWMHQSGNYWYLVNGLMHRNNGPAEYVNGRFGWYLNGELYISIYSFLKDSGLSDDEATILVLKYGT